MNVYKKHYSDHISLSISGSFPWNLQHEFVKSITEYFFAFAFIKCGNKNGFIAIKVLVFKTLMF